MTRGAASDAAAERSREAAILVAAARRRPDPDSLERLRALTARDVAWPVVLDLAERHRVPVLLLWSLDALDGERVPAEVLGRLRARSRELHRHALVLTAELIRCLDALAAAGIEAVPYKGPALGAVAYGDPGARVFGDLDIVVRPPDARPAFEVLERMGFLIDHRIAAERADRFFRFHCQHGFRGPAGVRVELHWGFLPHYHCFDLDPTRLWDRLTTIELAGRPVRHFGDEDLLLILSAHGYKHRWARLEWIAAIAEILRARPDLDGGVALAEARALGGQRILGLGVRLAADLLGAPAPPAIAREALGDPAVAASARAVERDLFGRRGRVGFWRRSSFRMRVRERWRDRFEYWRRIAAGADLVEGWSRPPARRPLELVDRPWRLVRLFAGRFARRA